MKKAELEKQMARKIAGGPPGRANDRYGRDAAAPGDRREQREHERSLGLVPFAVKLHTDLVREIHAAAQARGVGLSEITAELIQKGLKAK
jgi:hypothetical protein